MALLPNKSSLNQLKASPKTLFRGNTEVIFLLSIKVLINSYFVLEPFIFSENLFSISH